MKSCPSCHQEKPTSLFWKDSRRKDGITVYCIDCQRAKKQKHFQSLEAQEKRRIKNRLSMQRIRQDPERREKLKRQSREYQAMRRGTYAGVTKQDLVELKAQYGNACAYCGSSNAALGFDHLTPLSRGGLHEKSNLAPCCQPCNSKKGRKTLPEFISYLDSLKLIIARLETLKKP